MKALSIQLKSIFTILLFSVLAITSLADTKPPKIYGVCNCQPDGNKNMIIELTLHNDQTFTYFDNSDANNKLSYTGTWANDGKIIILSSAKNTDSFHSTWKIDDNKQCIKSRHKFNFRRICLVDEKS